MDVYLPVRLVFVSVFCLFSQILGGKTDRCFFYLFKVVPSSPERNASVIFFANTSFTEINGAPNVCVLCYGN